MKINSNTSFPYPILGVRNDIWPTLPETPITIEEIGSDVYNYAFKLTMSFDNEYIQSFIDKGVAEFSCEADCTNTFYNHCFHGHSNEMIITIPRKHVKGKVNLRTYITAITEIEGYDNPNKHEDFDGFTFNIEPGEVLAAFPLVSFDTDLRSDILHVAGTYMEIRKDDRATETSIRLDNEKIGIVLPAALYDIYQSKIGEQNVQIIHASLAYNALVCALYNLDDMRGRNLLWVRCLMARFNEDDKFSSYRDQIDKKDVPALALSLLDNPYQRLFDFLETTNTTDQ